MSFFSKHLKAFAVCATVCLATASTVQAGKHKNKNHHNDNYGFSYIYGSNGDCINPNDYFNNNQNNDCTPPVNECDDYTPPTCEPPPCNPPPECVPAVPLPAAATSGMLTMGLLAVGGLGRKALKLVRI